MAGKNRGRSALSMFFSFRVLREQWIRAKYEREEFVATRVCQDPCSAGKGQDCQGKGLKDQQQSVLFATLKTFKVGLSYMNCWMCRFCFESNFEKKLLRKGT